MALGPRVRVLLIAAVGFGALAALVWYLSTRYWTQPVARLAPPSREAETLPPPSPPATPTLEPTALPNIDAPPTATPTPGATPTTQQPSTESPSTPSASGDASRLLIPVAGVRPEQLSDTYNDARSEGRVHNAIDIIAPRGTPVLAVADGRIVRLFNSVKGGITIYQLSADEKLVYYYAHLDRYADGLKDGHQARRGETIGYVGDTGNATPGNYHLHFQVYRITDPKRFWDGENLNPYELLR
ncbi:MAG TPA: M23 family metallopeptidase [Pyrinomonadaceae bacterium]|nr:M23 family metallopeptidase [Pyrinomonadaceae bacterium]